MSILNESLTITGELPIRELSCPSSLDAIFLAPRLPIVCERVTVLR